VAAHNIAFVLSLPGCTLTRRRVVDFCRVATALCPGSR
jgi:hypothetical protein